VEKASQKRGLVGLRVVAFESRRAEEMAKLILSYGGEAISAPSMREVPLADNREALAFGRRLLQGGFDTVIFLTGVGTRALMRVMETEHPREQLVEALTKVKVVARGPKPVAALRELGVPVALAVPEPNTWRDLLKALDERANSLPLRGRRVAVQEYGVSHSELIGGLSERDASVTRVPVYEWALPEDTGPLRSAIKAIAHGELDVALFTTSVQVPHIMRVAAEMNVEAELRRAFDRIAIGSIGPITSEALSNHGLRADFEPQHPKMGFLVAEAAQRSAETLRAKRAQAEKRKK
jgi:uroporphyrinogen-III synthase